MNIQTMTTDELLALSEELQRLINLKLPKFIYNKGSRYKVQIHNNYIGTYLTVAEAMAVLAEVRHDN